MNTSTSSQGFLQAILESFVDGILVLTEQQDVYYANETAKQIGQRLTDNLETVVPKEVWQVCEALIDSREIYPDHAFVLEQEVERSMLKLRIRVQWLKLEQAEQPYLLVRLQDENQSFRGLAIAEAQNWGLTNRETQVWMLRRLGWERKEIATELYITLDTVKKHLKNIQMKRQTYLNEMEWQADEKEQNDCAVCLV
jgi:DNA-binding CsgD family transcriptional regulator